MAHSGSLSQLPSRDRGSQGLGERFQLKEPVLGSPQHAARLQKAGQFPKRITGRPAVESLFKSSGHKSKGARSRTFFNAIGPWRQMLHVG